MLLAAEYRRRAENKETAPKDPNVATMNESFRVVTRAEREILREEAGWVP